MVHVVDANVWMDFFAGGITFEFLKLPYVFVTSDVVVYELDQSGRPPGSLIEDHEGVGIREIAPKSQKRMMELRALYPENSIGDASSLVLAEVEKGVLLTGDKNLRIAADEQKVQYRGTLWLLDRMVDAAIIPPQSAAESLQKMIDGDRRLPRAECQNRLRKWSVVTADSTKNE